MSIPFAGDSGAHGSGGFPSRSTSVPLSDPSAVGQARRTAAALASRLGMGEQEVGLLGIIINELGSNAVRHAGGGEVLLRALDQGGARGIEVLCLDRGPGMRDLAGCFRDGFSTGGSMGTGLGAARRVAHAFDIFSAVGQGTAIVARVWAGPVPSAASAVGALAVPVSGESLCGDGWAVIEHDGGVSARLVDGLGHGAGAAEVADLAMAIFTEHAGSGGGPASLLERVHEGLRSTRGAAAAVAEIGRREPGLRFAAVGNIMGRILADGGNRSLVSQNGIVGLKGVRIQETAYPCPAGAVLVLSSDGLTTHWKTDAYPGILRRDPAILAGLLYRDFSRGRDDASVLVCRAA